MRRETARLRDNRAATPLFRAFGGRLVEPEGEAVRLAGECALHRLEWRVLSVLIPGVLGLDIFDGLWRIGGPWLACLAGVPALLFALHALSFLFGRRSPAGAFWCWAALLTAWAWWELRTGSGVPRAAAQVWFGFLGLQGIGLVGLGWRGIMRLRGRVGISVRVALAVGLHVAMALVWWRCGWAWGAACGAGICALWCWGTFLPGSGLYGPVATRVEGKGVLLTFDDGPHPSDTPAILDLLDRHGVKAVFFVIGDKVRDFPELAREIVARGHELGNHTMTHPQASMWCAGPARTRREIVECQRAIEEATGVTPRWFRAPVGHRNYFTHPVTDGCGLEVVGWSRRAFDTVETDVGKMAARLTDGVGDGDVLLLHEGTPVAVELLERVLEELEGVVARGRATS